MNTQCFVVLILLLSLVCVLNDSPASTYTEGAFDFDTLATTTILNAADIVVGEITDVSFVFELQFTGAEYPDGSATSGPLSIVTMRVDKDIKAAIEHAENPDEPEAATTTVRFVQVGGPYPDGSAIQVVGRRWLERGEYVFVKLVPSDYLVTNNGITVDSCILEYGTTFDVEKKGDVESHVIKSVWNKLDVPVEEMTRVVRATLKNEDAMRQLDDEMNGLGDLAEATRYQKLMDKAAEIEKKLNLPALRE